MDKYYYFVTQLPHLAFGQELQITRRYFLEEARKWLSENDYQCMIQTNINEYSLQSNISSKLLCNYIIFEYELRKELTFWRTEQKVGRDYKSIIFPSALVKEGNPLEVERNLMFFRWKYIDELETEHYFDLDAIIAYFLKLQILERLFSFDKEKGKAKFTELSSIFEEDNNKEVL